MKSLALLLVGLVLASALPNPAPYIYQAGRPLNIAHRGLCSILPENTLQAFSAALYQGADFIELDVVYTKDKELLVMHDPFLTRISNIKQKPQFATRFETRQYNGSPKTDWWTDKFTYNQLRTLTVKQAQAPGRLTIFDYQYTFPLLSDVIQLVSNFNKQHQGKRNPDRRLAGILIEAKDSQMYRDLYSLQIGQTILDLLKKYKIDTITTAQAICPIYLHSFDYGTVKYWAQSTELPRNYLSYGGQSLNLDDINKYATGIGFEDNQLWDYTENKATQTFTKARALGMVIHIWTFKDDVLFFNSKTNLDMYRIGQNVLKLDGIITQFSDIYAPIAQLYKAQNQEQQQRERQEQQRQLRREHWKQEVRQKRNEHEKEQLKQASSHEQKQKPEQWKKEKEQRRKQQKKSQWNEYENQQQNEGKQATKVAHIRSY